jgi:hypothetical protein
MIAAMLIVIMLQVRSFSTMAMVVLTGPLGLVGVVPVLLAFNQPFGFNAILGLIGLAGILMRNTLILTEQIKENRAAGLDDYHAVIGATYAARDSDRARCCAGLHPPHAFRVLGIDGLHVDRRHGGRDGPDSAVPSRALCCVVSDQAH